MSKVIAQKSPQAGGLTVSGSWVESGSCQSPRLRHLMGTLQREEVAALTDFECGRETSGQFVEPTTPSQLLQKTRVTSHKDENYPNIGGG